jgi:hypothetical protein
LTHIHSDHHNFLDKTLVSISCPIPGAEIRYTADGSEPTIKSLKYEKPFYVNKSGAIKSRAFLSGADDGYVAQATFRKLKPHEAVRLENPAAGLKAAYYEGSWSKLPDFDTMTTLRNFISNSMTLPEFAREEDFGLTFDGYIEIPKDGLYQFYLSSDDGSTLMIGDSLVIDNDGLHGEGDVAGEIALKAGYHTIKVFMFQAKGDRALALSVAGPGIEKIAVPGEWLFYKTAK